VFNCSNVSAQYYCTGDHTTKYELMYVLSVYNGVLVPSRQTIVAPTRRLHVLRETRENGRQTLTTTGTQHGYSQRLISHARVLPRWVHRYPQVSTDTPPSPPKEGSTETSQ